MDTSANVELLRTWHEHLTLEAWREGLEQGYQRGVQQGLNTGRQMLLLHLLGRKFGRLPHHVVAQLQTIDDPALLHEMSERLLAAASLREVITLVGSPANTH